MAILLTSSKTLSTQRRGITFCNDIAVKPTHCSPQTKSKIELSFKKSILSLILVIGLFEQTISIHQSPTLLQSSSGTCSYTYGDNGLLFQKAASAGSTSITRDSRGNVVSQKLSDGSTESLSWNALGKIASYAISGPTLNETRNYAYDERSRLTQEPYTLTTSANPSTLPTGTQTASYRFDPLNVRLSQEVTTDVANTVLEKNGFSQVTSDSLLNGLLKQETWTNSYDTFGEVISRTSSTEEVQTLTWDSSGRLVKVASKGATWSATYDGLGRRIETTSQGNTINYYYDPEVEFLELGHASIHNNGSWFYSPTYDYAWNLYGPDRSGLYGGAQGIGGLEASSNGSSGSHGVVNNFFGDALGLMSSGAFTPYSSILGGYGAMPGSAEVNQDLQPQWRGHYLDETGFYYMGARYYEPKSGRFISADPLGHSASLSLYDYCDGDPVNGLDPDGRCPEKIVTAIDTGISNYVNWSLEKAQGELDLAESIDNNFSVGNYGIAASQYFSVAGPAIVGSIIPAEQPAVLALKGAFLMAEEAAPLVEGTSMLIPHGYQGGPGAMWRGEVLGEASISSQLTLPGLSGIPEDIAVLGKIKDTTVAKGWSGHKVLDIQNWSRNGVSLQVSIRF